MANFTRSAVEAAKRDTGVSRAAARRAKAITAMTAAEMLILDRGVELIALALILARSSWHVAARRRKMQKTERAPGSVRRR